VSSADVLVPSSAESSVSIRDGLLEIRIAENPTTGYVWAVSEVDERVLRLEGSHFTPPTGKALGTGGLHTFLFRIVGTGRGLVELQLRRPLAEDAVIDRLRVGVSA
jgi:predicted secreted protein